eukprot:jgi/Psemu1/301194/fgenesh1_kg.27_\
MSYCTTEDPATLFRVAKELEELRRLDNGNGITAKNKNTNTNTNTNANKNDIHCYSSYSDVGAPFPRSCRKLLRSIPGNSVCVDCGNRNPDWASVTYGVLLCTVCSGRHRSYGVATSRVRSVTMDSWSHKQVLSMLEGGNEQLRNFYDRHGMGESSSGSPLFGRRYFTKAAGFYRTNLESHVAMIGKIGPWMGRAASRKVATTRRKRRTPPPVAAEQRRASATGSTTRDLRVAIAL